jgi:hypothetical protein
MLQRFLNWLVSNPALIPLYVFVAFMLGILLWEFVKLVIFVIRNTGDNKSKTEKHIDKGFH